MLPHLNLLVLRGLQYNMFGGMARYYSNRTTQLMVTASAAAATAATTTSLTLATEKSGGNSSSSSSSSSRVTSSRRRRRATRSIINGGDDNNKNISCSDTTIFALSYDSANGRPHVHQDDGYEEKEGGGRTTRRRRSLYISRRGRPLLHFSWPEWTSTARSLLQSPGYNNLTFLSAVKH